MMIRYRHVGQGDILIGRLDAECMTTVLGSCIAACLFDPQARIGGMVHFLLPTAPPDDAPETRHGFHGPRAIPMLRNRLVSAGAHPAQLRAKLFGGGAVVDGLCDIGRDNTQVAQDMMQSLRLQLVGQDTMGPYARRIRFYPTTGAVQMKRMPIRSGDSG